MKWGKDWIMPIPDFWKQQWKNMLFWLQRPLIREGGSLQPQQQIQCVNWRVWLGDRIQAATSLLGWHQHYPGFRKQSEGKKAIKRCGYNWIINNLEWKSTWHLPGTAHTQANLSVNKISCFCRSSLCGRSSPRYTVHERQHSTGNEDFSQRGWSLEAEL